MTLHAVANTMATHTTTTEARGATWDLLTRRSAALCRKDRSAWEACMRLADSAEAAGVDPLLALEQALLAFEG